MTATWEGSRDYDASEQSVTRVGAPTLSTRCAGPRLARLGGAGPSGAAVHVASFASLLLCIGLWIRAKTVDDAERGNAERRALFVGLWPAWLWLVGDAFERAEGRRGAPGRRP